MQRFPAYALLASTCLSGCAINESGLEAAAKLCANNKALVRQYYEDVVSSGNLESIPHFISSDYVYVHEGTRHELGVEGEREHVRSVRETYPDLTLEISRQIAEGDWVVTVLTARGTHKGVWLGMRPTNKPVQITAVNVDKVVNGRIVEHSGAANLFDAFLRIGCIKIADPVSMESQPVK